MMGSTTTRSRRRLWSRCFALLSLLSFANPAEAQAPGSISVIGETLVSAMMLILGNEEKVYILDKVEGNPTQINGHPAWAVEWDIGSSQPTTMDMSTNTFCSSGMHMPNGSFATFGGNGAIKPGGDASDTPGFDPTYQDFDGSLAIRILNPCTTTGACQWFDNSTFLQMQKKRWYSTAESLADGSIVLIGGFVNGGYVNRNFPNTDPTLEGGAAEPTYEFYPANGRQATDMNFMTTTSGLNAYAHAFLMSSGKMFVQANMSTILWDYNQNQEFPLPDMPNGVARVYPASGGVAMLPMTPANNWTQTIIFCGGSNISSDAYGSYAGPAVNTWEFPSSNDCQRITPEPTDGSTPQYVQDDFMLEGRTMGQFIILPDGKLLMINGGGVGTAGYATATGQTPLYGDMPYGMSLAAEPVFTPAIYDPDAPAGSRWNNSGLQASQVARLYHSSAILLPDGGVMVAGSNPNVDYNASTTFPTEYRAEKFYPPYFASSTKPSVSGIPPTLSYGGSSFDLVVDKSSYGGDSNAAAGNTTVVLMRPGFTTHGMNMGQRMLQLNNTYSVADDGTITLHCAQVPPNPNLLTPGPVFLFVVVNGIPSTSKMVIVGSGNFGTQPTNPVANLPPNQLSSKSSSGTAQNTGSSSSTTSSGISTGAIIGIGVGGLAVLAVIGATLGICISKRKKQNARGFNAPDAKYGLGASSQFIQQPPGQTGSEAFIPLKHYNESSDTHGTGWAPNQPTAMASSASFLGGGVDGPERYSDYDPYSSPAPQQAYGHEASPSYGSGGSFSPRSDQEMYAQQGNASPQQSQQMYGRQPREQYSREY